MDEQHPLAQAVKHMALQLGFVFSAFSVTLWLEKKPVKRVE
jgi:hypothetical protein